MDNKVLDINSTVNPYRLVTDVPYSATYRPRLKGHVFTSPSKVETEGYLSPQMKMRMYYNAGVNLQQFRNALSKIPCDSDLFENGEIPDGWTPDISRDTRLDITEVVDSVVVPVVPTETPQGGVEGTETTSEETPSEPSETPTT